MDRVCSTAQCSGQRRKQEGGFTLVELLTVIGIIGILAAIAIPQFSAYKKGGFDAAAQVALRTVATAEEAYFTENQKYVTCDHNTCPSLLPNLEPLAPGIVMSMVGTTTEFSGTAFHTQGTHTVFNWN